MSTSSAAQSNQDPRAEASPERGGQSRQEPQAPAAERAIQPHRTSFFIHFEIGIRSFRRRQGCAPGAQAAEDSRTATIAQPLLAFSAGLPRTAPPSVGFDPPSADLQLRATGTNAGGVASGQASVTASPSPSGSNGGSATGGGAYISLTAGTMTELPPYSSSPADPPN
jgi:hypothetical protein